MSGTDSRGNIWHSPAAGRVGMGLLWFLVAAIQLSVVIMRMNAPEPNNVVIILHLMTALLAATCGIMHTRTGLKQRKEELAQLPPEEETTA